MTSDVRPASLHWRGIAGMAPASLVLLAGLAVMVAPTLIMMSTRVWANDEQGHGPVILAVSLWLMWQRRAALSALPFAPRVVPGSIALIAALAFDVLGRSQDIALLEVLAPIVGGSALLLLTGGWPALWCLRLPLAFLLFVAPLPGIVVQTATIPLKLAVSYAAELLLSAFDYPVARTGVIIAIDQYHLLVADACAGLTSMFTLEALGLLYLGMRGYSSRWRNVLLAVSVIPIAFIANVIRVVVLVLVTYYFGDEAGQGFAHRFAGVVLFIVATLLMLGTDRLLGVLGASASVRVNTAAALVNTKPGAAMPLHFAALVALLLCAAVPVAERWRPTQRTSDIKGAIDLKSQIPERFGDWQVDRSLLPILPDPRLQSTLDATYSQVLARTYIDTRGRRVMLSIAYGDDQSSEATAVHRPEFCYRGQGFAIADLGTATLALPDNALRVQRLVGRLDRRFEPITYWITLDETATLPGPGRKWEQLRYGLRGWIADGMVMRLSTIGVAQQESFALQDGFIAQLSAALPTPLRWRYFGAGSAH